MLGGGQEMKKGVNEGDRGEENLKKKTTNDRCASEPGGKICGEGGSQALRRHIVMRERKRKEESGGVKQKKWKRHLIGWEQGEPDGKRRKM
jgi:hypothetical protein